LLTSNITRKYSLLFFICRDQWGRRYDDYVSLLSDGDSPDDDDSDDNDDDLQAGIQASLADAWY